MSAIFADAFLYIALLNRHDESHQKACEFLASARLPVVTTEWVLVEVADAFATSAVRPRIRAFIDDLRRNRLVRIIEASSTLFGQGLQLYAVRPDKEWSLTDCTSFVVMREHGLKEAATGDRHFEQAGFKVLLS